MESLLLKQLLLLLILVRCTVAFVYSCEEVKFKWVNSNFSQSAKYACIVTQEGYANSDQLKKLVISQGGLSTDLTSLVNSCWKNDGSPWKITAPNGFTLHCAMEFSLILTSDEPTFIYPKKQITNHSVQNQCVFAVPQTGMWIHNKGCTGEGSVNLWTGAGNGENEERYALGSWTCDKLPDWIYTFDNVITVEATGQVVYNVECSSKICEDLNEEPIVSPRETIVVMTNGRSDNLQNLEGIRLDTCIRIRETTYVSANLRISLDSNNLGAVFLRKSYGGQLYAFNNGTYTQSWKTDYFEIRWMPIGLGPTEIGNNQDSLFIELSTK